MMRFLTGNLFESRAQTLVNTVNCVGIMGKGIALLFKKRFPEMYDDYRLKCKKGKIHPGVLTIYNNFQPWVLNFPTKRHWKSKARLEDIELGLQEFVRRYQEWGITSVAMPALGCGHGGLDWTDVKPIIIKYLHELEIEIEVYEPGSEAVIVSETKSDVSDKKMMRDLFGNLVEAPEAKQKTRKRKTKKIDQNRFSSGKGPK